MGACGRNQDTFLRFDPMLDVGMPEHSMGPANTLYPEGGGRDTLFGAAVLPSPCSSRFPAGRALLRAPLSYARVSSAFARARCQAAGASSSTGMSP